MDFDKAQYEKDHNCSLEYKDKIREGSELKVIYIIGEKKASNFKYIREEKSEDEKDLESQE